MDDRAVSGGTQVTALTFTPDGTKLVAGCDDGEVSLWDTASAQRLAVCRHHTASVWTVSVSRGEGSLVASGPPSPPPLRACARAAFA